MADAKIYLFDSPSKQHKDGTFPIVLRVSHERKRIYFKTGYRCEVDQWSQEAGRFKKTKKYKAENEKLLKTEERATRIIRQFEDEDKPFDFKKFKAIYSRKENRALLIPNFDALIDTLIKNKQIGTAAQYKQAKSAIMKFDPKADELRLQDITPAFLLNFEHWLRTERGLKDTSISVYMRALRAIIKKAIRDKVLKPEYLPFGVKDEDDLYLISKLTVETAKRAITKDAVKAIEALVFPEHSPLQFAKDIFLFSYYTRGTNVADIAYLTPKNIEGEKLVYIRRKTKKAFSITLLPQAKQIIDFYLKSSQNAGKYIFPIFDDNIHKTEQQKFDRRKTALRDINKNLKEIAKMIGMEGLNLTSYVSRHTYANVLKQAGTNIAQISEALGHGSEKITQVYLKSFDDDELHKIDKDAL